MKMGFGVLLGYLSLLCPHQGDAAAGSGWVEVQHVGQSQVSALSLLKSGAPTWATSVRTRT